LFPGLPRSSFFSCAAFLGGIFFFKRKVVVEKDCEQDGKMRSGRETARRKIVVQSVRDRQNFANGDIEIYGTKFLFWQSYGSQLGTRDAVN